MADHPLFLSPFTFPCTDFSEELDLHIMFLNYDNWSLVVCTNNTSELICSMIPLFSQLSMVFLGVIFISRVQKHQYTFYPTTSNSIFASIDITEKISAGITWIIDIDTSWYLNIFPSFLGTEEILTSSVPSANLWLFFDFWLL